MKTLKLLYHWFNYKTAWFFSPHKPELEKKMYMEYMDFKMNLK